MKLQHILACDKRAFGIEGLEGFITMTPKTFFESVQKSLFIGRREELETDERFGQVLPYVVLYQRVGSGDTAGFKVFVYQRTKKVGEQRLAGNLSIGTGGHVDLADLRQKDSVVDVVATFATAISRELNEEIGFRLTIDGDHENLTFDQLRSSVDSKIFPRFVGMINDTSDAVGRVHYGFVFALEVPAGFEPYCLEAELRTVGMSDLKLAASRSTEEFENWSKIVLQNFEAITA